MQPSIPSSASRTITNPVLKDEVTFLQTSQESNGRHSLVEVFLSPGGGNPLHYHRDFAEEFVCLEGELSIQLEKQIIQLKPGESAIVPVNKAHRFFNQSTQPCRFECRITPGFPGFEQFLQIVYGLAHDGQVNGQAMPKNPFALGYVILISGTYMSGLMAVLQPILTWLGRQAIKRGLGRELQGRYIKIQ
ncbi:cupin domain-containing protein [Spirosoma pollinicola]|uniref:Cupin domain-containing protein n=1 Tax=Spirosoma pollinicola TaxID=2057025 RepID=A0A2K8YWR2_9BACT|nr:cupin domain-containing protein [Spirosoma pollinicola]AUD02071.1 cupin domain-containing protein [Spirosoma pollinicola]